MLTVNEAAATLGRTKWAVFKLIERGKLKATKKAGVWIITEGALAKVAKQERRPGRPRK